MNYSESSDIKRSTWDEFRDSGLLRVVNNILHIFGWCLVIEMDEDLEEVTAVYPARCKYDGFSEDEVRAYQKLGAHLSRDEWFIKNNARRMADFEERNS